MGGTFDPVHLGHLRAAENARRDLALDELLLVPAKVPPHRPDPLASAFDRFAMVALACAAKSCFIPSPLEMAREGESYTVDTVGALRQQRPGDDLWLIVGSDMYSEMKTWKEHERLFSYCRVAVVARPGEWPAATHPPMRLVEGSGLAISATEVRRRAQRRESLEDLVPAEVADYILKRGLYR